MKQSDSTEMDRLFRRYAGRKGETPLAALGADGETGSEANLGLHLDADEMNAYAEDVMPEAMRSRYFAHLADCDSCRKLVTELALVATRTKEAQVRVAATDVKPSKSWREVLSAILSPTALRYGLPAMAL